MQVKDINIQNMISLNYLKSSQIPFDSHYRLIDKIGGGGFSEVWLARDITADLDVALKIYTPNGELDESGKADFKREFRHLCSLNHSNIIHAVGFGIHNDELPYLAMSVCKNGSATKLIGNASETDLWDFIEQVASGLSYLHKRGIVHQDMKPANVLMNADGQYLIIDFGISTKTRGTLRNSSTGKIEGGTTHYMSAESFDSDAPSIYARDIWAFGATLFEIMTGDVPFGNLGGLTQKKRDGKIPEITRNYSEELKALVYKCLALNAWDRPSADELLEIVDRHKKGFPMKKPTSRKRVLSVALAVVAVVLAVGIISVMGTELVKNINIKETSEAWVNPNDSIFLAKVDEATGIVDGEKDKNVENRDETRLKEAAVMYNEAFSMDATDSIKSMSQIKWNRCQEVIDDTYSFLYNKGVYYSKMKAFDAAKRFSQRGQILSDYVSKELLQNAPNAVDVTETTDSENIHVKKNEKVGNKPFNDSVEQQSDINISIAHELEPMRASTTR